MIQPHLEIVGRSLDHHRRLETRLARLLRDTIAAMKTRAMLADIYNWFTEGFYTADLKDAKALLEELNNSR